MPEQFNQEELVKQFNARFDVGAKVLWRGVNNDRWKYQRYEVESPAYMNNDRAVCFLKGKSGFVSIEPGFIDYDYKGTLAYATSETADPLQDVVYSQLDAALEGHYADFLSSHTAIEIARDLVTNSSVLENKTPLEVEPYVAAWLGKVERITK